MHGFCTSLFMAMIPSYRTGSHCSRAGASEQVEQKSVHIFYLTSLWTVAIEMAALCCTFGRLQVRISARTPANPY
jgi:hypothetical protein